MKKIKTLLLRAHLLNKRLLKKPAFLIILLLIPLLTFAMVFFAKDDGGILTVSLCAEDPNDPLATTIINELSEEDGILRFVKSDSKEAAIDSVKYGKTDAAWIFSENLQEKIDFFISVRNEPFITVVERETDVSLQLSHEKLSGSVYPYVSRAIFKNYAMSELFDPNEITIDEIYAAYDSAVGGGSLIEFEKINGYHENTTTNFLIAPLRGILSLVVLLCGLAAVMFHQSDRENRIYDWLSPSKHIFPGIATTGAAVLDSTVITVIALAISGLFMSPLLEILAAITHFLAVTAFCTFIGCITRRSSRTGQIIPFLILIGLVVSPIFFNFLSLRPFQIIFPTFYYLYAVYQPIYIVHTLAYTIAMLGISFVLNKIIEK